MLPSPKADLIGEGKPSFRTFTLPAARLSGPYGQGRLSLPIRRQSDPSSRMVWLFQICEGYLKVVTALLRFFEMAVNMGPG